jgi:uncharacterized protein (UPF0303 family)
MAGKHFGEIHGFYGENQVRILPLMNLSRDLEMIAKQEQELIFGEFDEEIAWKVGSRLRELASDRRLPVAIELKRFGQPLFYSALNGSTPDNAEWVRRKGNVVARFHRSSYAIGLGLKQTNSTLADKYELAASDYASHGGSFPLKVAGAGVVGSVTVSGLPQRADHELVVEALCGQLGRDYLEFALPINED